MNYKIIHHPDQLKAFIDWLPDLEENEKFYCCLFSRKKYCEDKIKSSDKSQLKRFLSDKERLYDKIKQLEVEVGTYKLKSADAPQESLAVYINPNPRSMKKAMFDGIIKFTELLKNGSNRLNPHSEIMSVIQRSVSRKIYLDFDIDDTDFDLNLLKEVVNPEAIQIVQTRGGYHVLIQLDSIHADYKKSFYKQMMALDVDQSGDQLLPIPGCVQGGFVPQFITTPFG
ncbi:MAG: hypothetical protein P1U56_10465 [Saprospiraceae bacterium]|nr:hypothetical protein [Saprospiraceae bacterium]